MAFTYDSLRTAVIAATANSDAEFSTFLDTAINLTEDELARRLDSLGLTSVAFTSLIPGEPYVPKPDNCLIVKGFNIIGTDGLRHPLILRTNEFLDVYWPDRTSVGEPKYWSNFADTALLIAPAPTGQNEVEMEYVVEPSALGATTSSNWFSEKSAAALFAGVMKQAARFMKHWEAALYWSQVFDDEITKLNEQDRRARRDDSTLNQGTQGENNLQDRN